MCSLLSSRFLVSTDCTSSDKQLPLAQVSLWVRLLWTLPFTLCITALFAQQQPEKYNCTVSIPPRETMVCSIYNLVLHFCIFQQVKDMNGFCAADTNYPKANHKKETFTVALTYPLHSCVLLGSFSDNSENLACGTLIVVLERKELQVLHIQTWE